MKKMQNISLARNKCLIGIVTRRKACRARAVVARESGFLRYVGSLLAASLHQNHVRNENGSFLKMRLSFLT